MSNEEQFDLAALITVFSQHTQQTQLEDVEAGETKLSEDDKDPEALARKHRLQQEKAAEASRAAIEALERLRREREDEKEEKEREENIPVASGWEAVRNGVNKKRKILALSRPIMTWRNGSDEDEFHASQVNVYREAPEVVLDKEIHTSQYQYVPGLSDFIRFPQRGENLDIINDIAKSNHKQMLRALWQESFLGNDFGGAAMILQVLLEYDAITLSDLQMLTTMMCNLTDRHQHDFQKLATLSLPPKVIGKKKRESKTQCSLITMFAEIFVEEVDLDYSLEFIIARKRLFKDKGDTAFFLALQAVLTILKAHRLAEKIYKHQNENNAYSSITCPSLQELVHEPLQFYRCVMLLASAPEGDVYFDKSYTQEGDGDGDDDDSSADNISTATSTLNNSSSENNSSLLVSPMAPASVLRNPSQSDSHTSTNEQCLQSPVKELNDSAPPLSEILITNSLPSPTSSLGSHFSNFETASSLMEHNIDDKHVDIGLQHSHQRAILEGARFLQDQGRQMLTQLRECLTPAASKNPTMLDIHAYYIAYLSGAGLRDRALQHIAEKTALHNMKGKTCEPWSKRENGNLYIDFLLLFIKSRCLFHHQISRLDVQKRVLSDVAEWIESCGVQSDLYFKHYIIYLLYQMGTFSTAQLVMLTAHALEFCPPSRMTYDCSPMIDNSFDKSCESTSLGGDEALSKHRMHWILWKTLASTLGPLPHTLSLLDPISVKSDIHVHLFPHIHSYSYCDTSEPKDNGNDANSDDLNKNGDTEGEEFAKSKEYDAIQKLFRDRCSWWSSTLLSVFQLGEFVLYMPEFECIKILETIPGSDEVIKEACSDLLPSWERNNATTIELKRQIFMDFVTSMCQQGDPDANYRELPSFLNFIADDHFLGLSKGRKWNSDYGTRKQGGNLRDTRDRSSINSSDKKSDSNPQATKEYIQQDSSNQGQRPKFFSNVKMHFPAYKGREWPSVKAPKMPFGKCVTKQENVSTTGVEVESKFPKSRFTDHKNLQFLADKNTFLRLGDGLLEILAFQILVSAKLAGTQDTLFVTRGIQILFSHAYLEIQECDLDEEQKLSEEDMLDEEEYETGGSKKCHEHAIPKKRKKSQRIEGNNLKRNKYTIFPQGTALTCLGYLVLMNINLHRAIRIAAELGIKGSGPCSTAPPKSFPLPQNIKVRMHDSHDNNSSGLMYTPLF